MDGGVQAKCAVLRPDRYRFFSATPDGAVSIARGAGLSFAAASFGADAYSVELGSFDRVLGFDSKSGQIDVEAGTTLETLYRFLTPRGRYLPVQPGFGSITVGGCIACDVHGKNPARDGTFIAQVESLRLFHPDHGTIVLSNTRESELFRATCGGFGLTGIIIAATLRTRALPGWATDSTVHRIEDGNQAVGLLRQVTETSDLAYAWLDCARPHVSSFGRGLVFSTRIVSGGTVNAELTAGRLSPAHGSTMPFSLMNRWTVRTINLVYGYRSRRDAGRQEDGLPKVLFPIHGNELYFRLFGRNGFNEYQMILPHGRVPDCLQLIHDLAVRYSISITLAIARVFAGRNDLLRFDGDGISFALELPRHRTSLLFMADIDRFILEAGGRPNLYKDSRLPRAVFEATYQECDTFRAIRRAWDPRRRFRSELSERLYL
jgi:decaprenylphospho-beta-D-ribofuranose 2-oxidase